MSVVFKSQIRQLYWVTHSKNASPIYKSYFKKKMPFGGGRLRSPSCMNQSPSGISLFFSSCVVHLLPYSSLKFPVALISYLGYDIVRQELPSHDYPFQWCKSVTFPKGSEVMMKWREMHLDSACHVLPWTFKSHKNGATCWVISAELRNIDFSKEVEPWPRWNFAASDPKCFSTPGSTN